jgi:hypothetical protein
MPVAALVFGVILADIRSSVEFIWQTNLVCFWVLFSCCGVFVALISVLTSLEVSRVIDVLVQIDAEVMVYPRLESIRSGFVLLF